MTSSDAPRWRALLEARWQTRLRELTELSLAYHIAVAAADDGAGGATPAEAQSLLGRTVTARRKLADVEEALARLSAGEFGRCEQCRARIPDGLLAMVPEIRYCPRCDGPYVADPRLAGPRFAGPRFETQCVDGPPAGVRPMTGRSAR